MTQIRDMNYQTLSLEFIISMLIVLSSCNNDVFVDELKVSDTDIQMSGEGDSIIVEMSTPVWDIYTVNFEKEVLSTRSYLNENDSISYNGVVKGFTVKRIDDRHLSIRVDENLSKEDFKFNITMGDNFKTILIHVTQSPSAGYDFDHITYTFLPGSYAISLKQVSSIVFDNKSDSPITSVVSFFHDQSQKITFSSANPKAFTFLSSAFQVDIPSYVSESKDGTLQLSGKKASFNDSIQNMALPFTDVSKSIVLQPGATRVTRVLEFESFDAEYTFCIRNRKTGVLKNIRGKFHSQMPTGKNYYVILERL